MGFHYINDEQKIRISLSLQAYTVLNEDMRIFSIPKQSGFINSIITNFREDAKASLSLQEQKYRQQYEEFFEDVNLDETSKRTAVEHMVKLQKENTIRELNEYMRMKYNSKLYHINDANIDYLVNTCNEEDFYREKPGVYLKCILEEYATLSYIERQRIVKREIYDIVEYARKMNYLLQVKVPVNGYDKTFIVYPYKIISDPLNTQDYLACFTKAPNASPKTKIDASFSMGRLPLPTVLKQHAFLSKDDIAKIEEDIADLSVVYLLGEPQTIRVALTEQGKKMYRTLLYARPDKDDTLSSDNEYVFTCSELQAYHYFIPFGAEAEIISPLSLRDKFEKHYARAAAQYTGTTASE